MQWVKKWKAANRWVSVAATTAAGGNPNVGGAVASVPTMVGGGAVVVVAVVGSGVAVASVEGMGGFYAGY